MQANYDHEQLIDYIEGELPPEQMARVDALLASDAKLRRLIESIKADRKALRALPPDETPRALVEDVMAGLERQLLLGEAPVNGEDVDEIAAEAQRNRMTIGPRLLRIASYTGLAAALAIAGGVVFLTVTDSPLLEQANPQRWDTFGDEPLATRDGPGSRTGATDRLLTLDELDAKISKSGEAGSQPDGSPLALNKLAQTPTTPDGPANSFGKAGPGDGNAAVQSKVAAGGGQVGGVHPLLNAAQFTGNRGQFALRLPQPDEANAVIEVVSDDVDDTTEGLNRWLAFNGAQIVPAELAFGQTDASIGSLKETARQRSEVAGYAADKMLRQSAYAVVIDDDQVPELLNYMNSSRAGRQVARLVEPEQPQRVVLQQTNNEQLQYRYSNRRDQQSLAAAMPAPAEAAPREDALLEGTAERTEATQALPPANDPPLTLKGDGRQAPRASEAAEEHQSKDRREAMPEVGPSQAKAAQAPPADDRPAEQADTSFAERSLDEAAAAPPTRDAGKATADDAEAKRAGQNLARGVQSDQMQPDQGQSDPATAALNGPALEAESQDQPAQTPSPPAESAEPTRLAAKSSGWDEAAATAGADDKAKREATDLALSDRVTTFEWGAVLGNQLPLVESTPLAFARRGRVVLPLVITESTLGDRAGWRDMAEDAAGAANQSLEVPARVAEPVDPAE